MRLPPARSLWPHNLPPARRFRRHNAPLHDRRHLQSRLTTKPRQRQLTTRSRPRKCSRSAADKRIGTTCRVSRHSRDNRRRGRFFGSTMRSRQLVSRRAAFAPMHGQPELGGRVSSTGSASDQAGSGCERPAAEALALVPRGLPARCVRATRYGRAGWTALTVRYRLVGLSGEQSGCRFAPRGASERPLTKYEVASWMRAASMY